MSDGPRSLASFELDVVPFEPNAAVGGSVGTSARPHPSMCLRPALSTRNPVGPAGRSRSELQRHVHRKGFAPDLRPPADHLSAAPPRKWAVRPSLETRKGPRRALSYRG